MTGHKLQNELRFKTEGLYQQLEKKIVDASIVSFKALVGDEYPTSENKGIIFYGRCSNGWDPYKPDGSEKGFADVFSSVPFFELLSRVYKAIYHNDWMGKVVFNNVAKMVPPGGNCGERLWAEQYEEMKEIIRIENEVLSPKYTILVVGNTKSYNWEGPFRDLGFLCHKVDTIEWERGSTSIYKYGNQFFIVTDRPETRKLDPHAAAILELISRVEKGKYV